MTADNVTKALKAEIKPGKAEGLERFFKTKPGQYGEGDKFIGVMVPNQRKVSRMFVDLPLSEIKKLVDSPIHEYRQTAVMILGLQYKKFKKDFNTRKKIIDFYLVNTKQINNWDIVDGSAPMLGEYLMETKDTSLLDKLAGSSNMWEQRIAIVATFSMIKNNSFEDSFRIMKLLMNHKHDLIHKALGWMLREIGKRDRDAETKFLNQYYKKMPRTMLRYAIEHYPEDIRRAYIESRV